jgi:hypothetical protein
MGDRFNISLLTSFSEVFEKVTLQDFINIQIKIVYM